MSAGFFSGRKGRARRETLTAYLFLLPSIAIIFVFGLWPVIHALYVSLHKWNIKPKGSECLPYWLASVGLGAPDALENTDCLGLDNYDPFPPSNIWIRRLIAGYLILYLVHTIKIEFEGDMFRLNREWSHTGHTRLTENLLNHENV